MEWARRISSCVAGSAGRLSQLSVPRGSSLMNSPHSMCPRALLSATPVATNHSSPFPFSARNSRTVHSGWHRTKLVCATAGSCLFIGLSFHSTAICEAKRHSPPLDIGQAKHPKLKLYQYRTCPFCCKARAYLDYTGIAYEVVEVNPLFKKEIKFSEYRSVPFIVTSDSTQINDSSLLISVLQTFLTKGGALSLSEVQDLYPEMSYTDSKGKQRMERANKYFIMFGETGDVEGVSLAERREEREWREWVDHKLIHTLSPNIYRTASEALQSFQYISSVGNFNAVERVAAKYCGATIMYLLSKQLKKKYALKEDVRESLYDCCKEWTAAVGKDRKFMGGEKPNLADLAVYGVLSAIEGLATFTDMVENTDIGNWYWATKELVHEQTK